jgi:hypothetical protein
MTPTRTLDPAPDAVIDPSSGEPRFGSYTGAVKRVDLGPVTGSALRRVVRRKRWVYCAIASEDVFVALAIVRLGYAATCFAYALDARAMKMIATRSVMAPPTLVRVGDSMHPAGGGRAEIASFRFPGTQAQVSRGADGAYAIEARFRGFTLEARLDASHAPPPITAIAPVGDSERRYVNTTEKRALLSATGELTVDGHRRAFRGALAGYDYTHGLLARRTLWRWAFAMGRATTGERVAFNLVQGFVGEPECAAWVDGALYPLAEGRFAFDRDHPLSPWRVTTADGALDMAFAPAGMHAEDKDLGLLVSRFVQPCGAYRGTMQVGGKRLTLERALGVTEDQFVVW